ncbi:asparagine synthase (glutamine-hydrolysing) [Flavobacteriaceae bacterium MAR_2010_72]|nr:asparagine synthase (glutamine-hydrolysing) [Flavobacteriaceae bacterium MAR_2010_72]TVZ58267.1 asparagine synthase (glutamine-hydrolysing) [Flavobacteriaceae bacterium MAR_2010_105]
MCGISGFIGFENNSELAIKANKTQVHRGPDSQDIWFDNHIALSHQRLSIIDLNKRSNQPLHKDEYVIIYNGELYNYKELKKYLIETHDSIFTTQSDTEVILEFYIKEKEQCLRHFEGMFAFAIYNKKSKEVFLARDHFGIKPLFYSKINSNICFSSELKTLIEVPGFSKAINKKSLISSLNYVWIPGNESMFIGTYKLPPAHFMTISPNKKIKLHSYWELSSKSESQLTEKAVISQLEDVLEESIKKHMISDVPVSTFLSGGLDSSLISVIASKHTNKLSTYTITTTDKDRSIERMPDDQKYARIVAQQNEFDHNEIELSPDIIKLLPEMVKTLDEPIGDPAAINTYLICKAARQRGVKVLLSGMGADELFFGYQRHRATLLSRYYYKLPQIIKIPIFELTKLLPVRVGKKGIKITRWAKRFLSFASLQTERAYMRSYSYYNEEELNNLLVGNNEIEIKSIYNDHKLIFDQKFKHDTINQICNTDINMFMNGLNLTYSDRASMAASVEVRVPFIDKKVVEFAMTIPSKFKYKNHKTKYILKRAAEKYLDKDIIYRKKASFGAPIRSWVSNELKSMVDELLSKEQVENRGIFNYEFIADMINKDREGKQDYAYQIYQLLTIELWFRAFVD